MMGSSTNCLICDASIYCPAVYCDECNIAAAEDHLDYKVCLLRIRDRLFGAGLDYGDFSILRIGNGQLDNFELRLKAFPNQDRYTASHIFTVSIGLDDSFAEHVKKLLSDLNKIETEKLSESTTAADWYGLAPAPKCECGAQSLGYKQRGPGHSSWCPRS